MSNSLMTIDELAIVIANSFAEVNERFQTMEQSLNERFSALEQRFDKRFDVLEFMVAGHDTRLSTVEDRVRMLGTKAGLDFRKP